MNEFITFHIWICYKKKSCKLVWIYWNSKIEIKKNRFRSGETDSSIEMKHVQFEWTAEIELSAFRRRTRLFIIIMQMENV